LAALGAHAAGFAAARRCLRFLVYLITFIHLRAYSVFFGAQNV